MPHPPPPPTSRSPFSFSIPSTCPPPPNPLTPSFPPPPPTHTSCFIFPHSHPVWCQAQQLPLQEPPQPFSWVCLAVMIWGVSLPPLTCCRWAEDPACLVPSVNSPSCHFPSCHCLAAGTRAPACCGLMPAGTLSAHAGKMKSCSKTSKFQWWSTNGFNLHHTRQSACKPVGWQPLTASSSHKWRQNSPCYVWTCSCSHGISWPLKTWSPAEWPTWHPETWQSIFHWTHSMPS